MLKKITLAAFVALGGTTLAGVSAPPAAADDTRSVRVLKHGGLSLATYKFRHVRRGARMSRHGPGRRFLKRVRRGAIACFKKPSPRRAAMFGRRGHRYDQTHGRRLGYGAVRRLVRQGRRHAMRCFRRV